LEPSWGQPKQAQERRKPIKRSLPIAMKVKLVAIEALESGPAKNSD
jgi:hypothetical protein